MDKCGIYKITNKINNKSYIGESVRIKARWCEHKRKAFDKETYPDEYDKVLYKAFRKYGLDNFDFDILLECSKKDLHNNEILFIEKYDTYKNGYNESIGGDARYIDNKGEKNAHSKVKEEDVIDIRTRYSKLKETQAEIYEDYKDIISFNGFKKIFNGYTWKHIMMEVYTDENKKWHFNKNLSRSGSKNGRSILNETEVKSIKERFNNGETKNQIYQDYKDRCSRDVIYNIFRKDRTQWKNV